MAKSWILIHCNSAKGGVSSPERCIRTGRDGYNTLSILTFLYQQQFHHSIITTCITIDQLVIDLEIKQEMEKGRDSWMYWGKHSILIFLCPPHLNMSIYANRKCHTLHLTWLTNDNQNYNQRRTPTISPSWSWTPGWRIPKDQPIENPLWWTRW